MKLDRRGFIKLAVGAAAGIGLTPLPWKLTDDIAIWTQNWFWVPRLIRYPDLTYARTVCTLCEGGCGIKVRLVNEKQAIKVEGSETAPVNQGKVCPIGAVGPQYQYSLARFQSPLRRIGARGSGAFAKITWAEAFREVGSKLAELRQKGQAHTLAMVSGRGNNMARVMAERFMRGYGSPNLVSMPSLGQARDFAENAQFGRKNSVGYDLENSKYILSFGTGLIEGWGSPVRSIQAFSSWQSDQGTKLVQVDTRASLTASKADEWVAVAPGTEAALALGLANVIIKSGLYDRKFVAEHSFGFDEFAALAAKDYTPTKVSTLTGVPRRTVIKLAHEFAGKKQAVAIAGKGRGDIPTPVYEIMAVQALNALVGNINQPGGVIVRKDLPLAPWPELIQDETARAGFSAPRLDLAGTDKYPLTTSLLNNFVESIHKGRLYQVNALIIDRANPAYFGADPNAFRAALDKIPFIISLSGLADDTSIHADIVLPETANFEGPADVINPPTLPYPLFGSAGPVLPKPHFNTKPAGDIYIGLAKAVGGPVAKALPFKDYQEAVKTAASGLFQSKRGRVAGADGDSPGPEFGTKAGPQVFSGVKAFHKAMDAGQFWYDPAFTYGRLDEAFPTPSGKFEFLSQTVKAALARFISSKGARGLTELGLTKRAAQAFLPHYEPYVPAGTKAGYPLLLMPVEQFKLVNSSMGNAPYLTKVLEDITLKGKDLVVEVNPATAEQLDLKEGDRAWLKTEKGKLTVRVHLFDGARPEVVYTPIGLGHTGFDLYLRGKGVNPMKIVETTADPLSGQALWWGTRANLIKV